MHLENISGFFLNVSQNPFPEHPVFYNTLVFQSVHAHMHSHVHMHRGRHLTVKSTVHKYVAQELAGECYAIILQ